MRLVIQRVKKAKVKSDGKVIGEIGKGLFVLVGVGRDDKPEYADIMADRVLGMRIMADDKGKMNLTAKDVKASILIVSQFSLYADTSQRRPSFIKAASTELAKEVYERFVRKVKESGVKVEIGKFGAYMEIESVLDGPVTIALEHLKG